MRRNQSLDGLRGVAALIVVTTHVAFWTGNYTGDALGYVLARGDFAVSLFFVLSGYLLATPWVRAAASGGPHPAPAPYFWRRVLRILPAYWLIVVVALLVLPENRGSGVGTWLAHLGLLQIYGPPGAASHEGLVHLWSLCTEAAFYLVLPAFARWLTGAAGGPFRPARMLWRLAAVSVAGFVWLGVVTAAGADVGPLNLWLPAYAAWFAVGIAFAVLTAADPAWRPVRLVRALAAGPGTCWAGAAALFWLSATPLAGPISLDPPTVGAAVTKSVLYTLIAVLVTLPLMFGDPDRPGVTRVLSTRPVVWVGEVSYGLFLYHMIVLVGGYELVGRPPFTGSMVLVLVVVLGVSLLLAGASYRWLEVPVQRHGRGLVPEPRRSVPAGGDPDGGPHDDDPDGPLAGPVADVLGRATSVVLVPAGGHDVAHRTGPAGFLEVTGSRRLTIPAPAPAGPGTAIVVVATAGERTVRVDGVLLPGPADRPEVRATTAGAPTGHEPEGNAPLPA